MVADLHRRAAALVHPLTISESGPLDSSASLKSPAVRVAPQRVESMSLHGFRNGISPWQRHIRAESIATMQRAESSGVPDVGPRTLSPLVAGLLARRQGPLEDGKPRAVSGRRTGPELNPSETLEAAAVFHPVSPPHPLRKVIGYITLSW